MLALIINSQYNLLIIICDMLTLCINMKDPEKYDSNHDWTTLVRFKGTTK
jgi:hypothetical protein